jgi:hypothetical protein
MWNHAGDVTSMDLKIEHLALFGLSILTSSSAFSLANETSSFQRIPPNSLLTDSHNPSTHSIHRTSPSSFEKKEDHTTSLTPKPKPLSTESHAVRACGPTTNIGGQSIYKALEEKVQADEAARKEKERERRVSIGLPVEEGMLCI